MADKNDSNLSSTFAPLTPKQKQRRRDLTSTPIEPVNFDRVQTVADLVEAFGGASIQARNINLCSQVFERMLTDADRPTILLGIAGPLIAAGLRKVLRDMIAHRMVDVVVSTGAILYQDLYQSRGNGHFRGSPNADDRELRALYLDRIYDTYVDEYKFLETDSWCGKIADTLQPRNYSSREYLWNLSSHITDENSILHQARKYGVPCFAPAINDSSIGIGLTDHYHRKVSAGKPHLSIDSIRDNYELTQIVVKSPCTAAIYVAGGVPKNYINDSVVMSYIFGKDTGGHRYAFQVTTDVPHWGGLSGSTLDEAMSWGKVNVQANKAMAFVEPSVSLPLIVGSALQKKIAENRPRLKLEWEGDRLKSLAPERAAGNGKAAPQRRKGQPARAR